KLRGVYKHAWSRNQLALRTLGGVLDTLEARGIEALVVKGAGLIADYYRDAGARPMGDLDVVVRPAAARAAFAALRAAGWSTWTGEPERYVPVCHAHTFTRGGEIELDLHWFVLMLDCRAGADDSFWRGAVTTTAGGRAVRTLDAAAHVVHAIVHGRVWNPLPGIRWVADVVTVIRAAPALDWDRVVALSLERRLGRIVGESLAYLVERFRVTVPPAVLATLEARRAKVAWRGEHFSRPDERRHTFASNVGLMLREYSWLARRAAPWERPGLLVRFLQVRYRKERVADLVGTLVAKVAHRA
ncbi:MAG: nucleotidyltransferase family protein, partial [Planctomycetota bacterium]